MDAPAVLLYLWTSVGQTAIHQLVLNNCTCYLRITTGDPVLNQLIELSLITVASQEAECYPELMVLLRSYVNNINEKIDIVR